MHRIINLLPTHLQKDRRLELVLLGLRQFVVVSIAAYALVICGQLAVSLLLAHRLSAAQADIAVLKSTATQEESQALKDEVRLVNSKIQDYLQMSDAVPQWSVYLQELVKTVPRGVRVQALSISLTTKQGNVSGVASQREGVLEFYENLSKRTDLVTQVNFPFENIVKEINVPYSYLFTVPETSFKIKP